MSRIAVQDLGKCYRLYDSPRQRLQELLTGKPFHQPYWALRNTSFSLESGESLAIIGDNGAGKSTLMKLVAGALLPTEGAIAKSGRTTAILELGTGFHPDASGMENIRFAGELMGISRQEIARYYDSIVEFSELGRRIDDPIKTYSTGMVMRLAFSLVTAVNPENLIIDEALAVGDRSFQKKCLDRMLEIKDQGVSILFCSHSMHHVMQFCDKAIWLSSGTVKEFGDAESVVNKYIGTSVDQQQETLAPKDGNFRSPGARCTVTALESIVGSARVTRGEQLRMELSFRVELAGQYALGLAVDRDDSGVRLVAETSVENGYPPIHLHQGEYRVQLVLDTSHFREGRYLIKAGLLDDSLLQIDDYRVLEVDVADTARIRSPAQIRCAIEWDVEGRLFK